MHLCSFTDAIFTYTLNGREYHCEFSKWFGPLWTDKDGMPWKVQPQPGGKHWEKFEEWHKRNSHV